MNKNNFHIKFLLKKNPKQIALKKKYENNGMKN